MTQITCDNVIIIEMTLSVVDEMAQCNKCKRHYSIWQRFVRPSAACTITDYAMQLADVPPLRVTHTKHSTELVPVRVRWTFYAEFYFALLCLMSALKQSLFNKSTTQYGFVSLKSRGTKHITSPLLQKVGRTCPPCPAYDRRPWAGRWINMEGEGDGDGGRITSAFSASTSTNEMRLKWRSVSQSGLHQTQHTQRTQLTQRKNRHRFYPCVLALASLASKQYACTHS